MNAPFARLVADTTPQSALDASFVRMAERHGLTHVNVGVSLDDGRVRFTAYAHRDLYCGWGYGDTSEVALAKAIADLTAKASVLPLEGELRAARMADVGEL